MDSIETKPNLFKGSFSRTINSRAPLSGAMRSDPAATSMGLVGWYTSIACHPLFPSCNSECMRAESKTETPESYGTLAGKLWLSLYRMHQSSWQRRQILLGWFHLALGGSCKQGAISAIPFVGSTNRQQQLFSYPGDETHAGGCMLSLFTIGSRLQERTDLRDSV